KEIMGFSQEQVKGKVISDIIPSLKVADVLQSGSVKLNQLQLIKDKQIIANIIPINVGGEITGAVITFEDVTTIQKTEQQIRRKLYSKGMVAKFNFKDIIGKSKAIQDTIEVAKNFGQTDSTVLITGETGTGKELFAQSIHNISKRKENPFVAINCAAFPETLLESELFGYEEGAFTGAKKGGKPGLFEMAHTGTIFLDEIGEISPTLQARLLRVLQEKEVMRIGGDKIIPINVRIIAATNKDLKKAVKEGAFREDLFYRLNVLQLKIPPLRDRKEDIPLLIKHFLMIKEPGLIPKLESFIPEICSLTKDYTWPGNVREVENLVERIIALNKQLDISKNHNWLLKAIIDEQIGLCPQDNLKSLPAKKPNQTLDIEVEQAERAAILKTLEQCKGNKTKAAKQLGISRSTLWRKLREI
ncbi:MAG: hypothetical protein PWP65_1247, partial [Clostridia bacterium]|nr:hypothetical protein [Clostridia bacterium]